MELVARYRRLRGNAVSPLFAGTVLRYVLFAFVMVAALCVPFVVAGVFVAIASVIPDAVFAVLWGLLLSAIAMALAVLGLFSFSLPFVSLGEGKYVAKDEFVSDLFVDFGRGAILLWLCFHAIATAKFFFFAA